MAQSAMTLFALGGQACVAAGDPAALFREPLMRRLDAMAKLAGAPAPFVRGRTQLAELGTYPEALPAGCVLLLPDASPAEVADLDELRRLQARGVRAIFVPHVADPDTVVRVALRRFPRWRRALHWAWLALHAVALVAVRWHVAGCRWESRALRRVPHVEHTELCLRYALFQGTRQMPPIPLAHADIEWRGGGRYSVWHRRLVFSPAAGARGPRMLVPRNRWTAPFLEFDAEAFALVREEETAWLSRVEAAVREGAPPYAPNPLYVVLTHCLAPGGAERQWCYLAIGLKRLGHEACVVLTHDMSGAGAHYLPLLQRHGIALHALEEEEGLYPGDGNPFGARLPRLAALLARLRPAAVFAQLDAPNILAGLAAHAAGVPRVVLSFRNYNPTHFPYIHRDWMLPCYRALAASPRVALCGNSHAANRDYAAWIGAAARKVHAVPNAVDADGGVPPAFEESAALRAALGIADGAPVIIGVFRLSEEKRPFDFLEACRRVRRAVPSLRVLVVGEGPLQERLRAQAEPWLQLLGRRTDVMDLLHLSDLLLLASSHEGMPNAVMEAQLAGLPVVASRTGGLPECVRDGITGLLVEPGDVEGYARACLRLLFDPAAARAMGERGARRMRAEFGIEAMARRYLALVGAAP